MLKEEFAEISSLLEEMSIDIDIRPEYYSIFIRTLYSPTLEDTHLDDLIGLSNFEGLQVDQLLTNPYQDNSFLRIVDVDHDKQRLLVELATRS